MLLSTSDLTSFTAEAHDTAFPIKNAFFSLEQRRLNYLVVDTGTWFTSDMALISTGLILSTSTEDRIVKLNTNEAYIKAAPAWQEGSSSLLEAMPPIFIGPFGNTISPLMIAALAEDGETERPPGKPLLRSLIDFDSFAGLDVFGYDGELGHVTDILFDNDSHALTHLVIDTGPDTAARERLIPIEKLRHKAEQETHVVLDLTTNELNDAPRLTRTDTLEQERVEALHRYYGIQHG